MTNLTTERNGCVLGQWLVLTPNIKQGNKNSVVKEKIKKKLICFKVHLQESKKKMPSMVTHACEPGTLEAEDRLLHSKTQIVT